MLFAEIDADGWVSVGSQNQPTCRPAPWLARSPNPPLTPKPPTPIPLAKCKAFNDYSTSFPGWSQPADAWLDLTCRLTRWVKIIGAAGLVVMSYFQYRLVLQIKQVKEANDEQHKATNSRLDEYKDLIAVAEHAKGVKAGRAEMKAETAAGIAAIAADKEAKQSDVLSAIGTPVDGTLSRDVANVQEAVADGKATKPTRS